MKPVVPSDFDTLTRTLGTYLCCHLKGVRKLWATGKFHHKRAFLEANITPWYYFLGESLHFTSWSSYLKKDLIIAHIQSTERHYWRWLKHWKKKSTNYILYYIIYLVSPLPRACTNGLQTCSWILSKAHYWMCTRWTHTLIAWSWTCSKTEAIIVDIII